MLDEILELFERDKGQKKRPGGLRARIARAIAGDDPGRDEHRYGDDRYRPVERRYDDDDDDDEYRDRRRSKRSRFGEAFDFD